MFDRELRHLVSFLSSVTTWSIRERFSRLTQMATLVNLESVDEATDVFEHFASTAAADLTAAARGGSGAAAGNAKLSPVETRQVLELRYYSCMMFI